MFKARADNQASAVVPAQAAALAGPTVDWVTGSGFKPDLGYVSLQAQATGKTGSQWLAIYEPAARGSAAGGIDATDINHSTQSHSRG